jgi:5-methylthioadenosine/S-adenosylhomocysteine deaminase
VVTSPSTLVRARQVIAFQDGRHVLLEPGALTQAGGSIRWVGPPDQAPPSEREIDLGEALVTPGFVNLHTHVTTPATRSLREDQGNPLLHMSGLYELLPISWAMRPEEALVCAEASLIELLRTGSTTVLVMGTGIPEQVAELARRLGIRVYITPGYRSADWSVEADGRRVSYSFDERRGEQGLERNVAFARDVANGGSDDLVHALLGPLQVDTCTPELLRQTRQAADRLGVPIQIHAGQSLVEFQEIRRRYGRTPVQFLHDVGLCGPDVSIAHAVFIAGHSWTATPPEDDLELLARSGTTVAHCPQVFARTGVSLESLPAYLRAGVRVALGTDTFPQDLLHEARVAALIGKVAARDARVPSAASLFAAATLAGAEALRRADLGRIAPGARADLLVWSLRSVSMVPARDPLRTLLYSGSPAELQQVIVSGEVVVEDGRVLHADEAAVSTRLADALAQLWSRLPQADPAGRSVEQLSPTSLPRWSATARR